MPQKKSQKSKVKSQNLGCGFSLLEVMVSIALIGLVVAIALPNLRQFNRNQEIDSTAGLVVNTLRTAQSSAASRIKCPSGQSSNNWNTVMTASTYTLNASCTSGSEQTLSQSYKSAPNSPTTFLMTSDRCPSQTLTFIFSGQQLAYYCGATQGSEWPVTITLSGGGLSKQIVVDSGGVIKTL